MGERIMTVAELIKQLSKMPQHLPVAVRPLTGQWTADVVQVIKLRPDGDVVYIQTPGY